MARSRRRRIPPLVNNVANHDTWQVTISYNATATQLTETYTDLTNPLVASTTVGPTTENLATLLGASTAYVGFTGGTGGSDAAQTISNFTYSVATPGNTTTYANNLILTGTATSTIDIAATAAVPTITAGSLTVNSGAGTTLDVTATTAPAAQAYGLTLGTVALNGNVTFNVANNTNGSFNAIGTLSLGAISDANGGFGITTAGAGTVLLTGVNSYLGSTTVNASSTLTVAATGALSTTSNLIDNGTVNLNSGSPSSMIAALNGSGTMNLNGAPLTVAGGGTFGGTIVDGSSSGSLTVGGGTLTLAGASSYTGGTTIAAEHCDWATGPPPTARLLAIFSTTRPSSSPISIPKAMAA